MNFVKMLTINVYKKNITIDFQFFLYLYFYAPVIKAYLIIRIGE